MLTTASVRLVRDLLSIADAQRLVLERVKPLDGERVPIERAAGRVLVEPAVAVVDLPPFRSSAMDGFAVRSQDTARPPAALRLAGEVVAGRPSSARLEGGQAIAISTGGAVPEGADAVVPIELVGSEDDAVTVREPVHAGANVRERGGDASAGTAVLDPGALLGPGQVAALAAAGVAEVRCAKRPRVAILVTGSELRQPGEELGPGEIYESNALLLAAALQSAGAVPAQLGVVPDDREEHRRALERALLGFDMLVTSGGASVGPHDLVREVQADLRVEEVFWGVAIKPGKPVAFGLRRDHLVFNLPGNPVSVLVTYEVLVRPAVHALLGLPDPLPRYARGLLAAPVRRQPRRHEFVRARSRRQGDDVVLEPLPGQESHMIVRAAEADALLSIEPGDAGLDAGETVRYLSLACSR
jgi:molybdopterin molybdotransferase